MVRDELLALEPRNVESAARLEVSVAPLIQPNMPERYRQEVTGLRDALSLPEGRTEATALLRNFVNEIRLTPAEGILTIAVKGNPAGVLSAAGISALASGDGWLAAGNTDSPPYGGGMSSKRLPFRQDDRVSKGVRTKDFRSCRRPTGSSMLPRFGGHIGNVD